jgi:tRNA-modifying protein YgfZ
MTAAVTRNPASATPESPFLESARIAARDAAVVCDLASLRVLAIAGVDAATFLNGQLSVDVGKLAPGTVRHASFNSPKGRMLANFALWRTAEPSGDFRIVLPADIAEPVRKRLSMYVLRAKVALTDVSAREVCIGVGGPAAADALRASLGEVPAPFAAIDAAAATVLGLPGPRYLVVAPAQSAEATREALLRHACAASVEVWQWLTIRAGVPVITAATQDLFVAQAANWDVLGGVDFQKGCYTGQEIIARTQYLGRLKERAFVFHLDAPPAPSGQRIYNTAFGEQACGTVVNAAAAPGGGCDLLVVLQIAAAERGDSRLGAPDGPPLVPLPLPYAMPAPAAPRGRIR